jgi:hypothetical protein
VNPIVSNGALFNARFVALGTGVSPLVWNQSQSELASSSGDVILNTTFRSGTIASSVAPSFSGPVAGNLSISLFGSTTLSASVAGASLLQWQVSSNGSVWSDVVDGAYYSGATTSQLSLSNVQGSMNGLLYRLRAQNALGCERFSSVVTISVNVPSPIVQLVHALGCSADTITIPVTMLNGYNLGAITLGLTYNSAQFEFIGASDLASAVAPSMLINAPAPGGSILISWYDLNPVNINGLLFNLKFRPLVTGVTSPVTWDLSFNELADSSAAVISGVTYSNGSLEVLPSPAVSVGNASGCVGSSVSVPVAISSNCPIGAISLTIPFNSSILSYTGFSSALSAINDSNLTVNVSNDHILP